jgi:hypothetical protein
MIPDVFHRPDPYRAVNDFDANRTASFEANRPAQFGRQTQPSGFADISTQARSGYGCVDRFPLP